MDYVELRSHSAFSFGDGAVSPEALVRRAAELGYGALGLTDHVDLGGVIRFVLEAKRVGIRPVVGAELVVDGHPAAFLAMDRTGFRNLASLVTRSRMGDWGVWVAEKEALEEQAGRSPYIRDLREVSRRTAVTPRSSSRRNSVSSRRDMERGTGWRGDWESGWGDRSAERSLPGGADSGKQPSGRKGGPTGRSRSPRGGGREGKGPPGPPIGGWGRAAGEGSSTTDLQ